MEFFGALIIFIILSVFLAIGKALAPDEGAKAEWQRCKDHLDYGSSGSPGCAAAAWILVILMVGATVLFFLQFL